MHFLLNSNDFLLDSIDFLLIFYYISWIFTKSIICYEFYCFLERPPTILNGLSVPSWPPKDAPGQNCDWNLQNPKISIWEGITSDALTHEPYIYQPRILIPWPTNRCFSRPTILNGLFNLAVRRDTAPGPPFSRSVYWNFVSRIAQKKFWPMDTSPYSYQPTDATSTRPHIPHNENPPLGRSREAHLNEPESLVLRGSDALSPLSLPGMQ